MNKLYNTQKEITNNIRNFLSNNTYCLHKPQLKFLPEVIFGMIFSESLVAQDISLKLKDDFSLVQNDSIVKRIHRLMKNERYEGHNLFNQIVKHIISNMKLKHDDKRVHIVIDHMYSKENYTILMASMRIGKQGIPIYFQSFEGFNNSEAYLNSLLIKSVYYIHELFKDTDFNLIFLADRWFNSYSLLNTIDILGHTYVIRLKGNINIQIFDKKEGHKIRKQTGDLASYQFKSKVYKNVKLFESHDFETNIIRSKRKGVSESWIIATNGDIKRAIKDYGYRFGGIETIFKHQKSNGFYLEDIVNASMIYFENLYSTLCITLLLLTSIGIDYSRNNSCYKNIKITTHKIIKNQKIRVLSVIRTGITLFNLAFNSSRYIRLPLNFNLYDL